ncbi:MAG: HlyD family efflux transporter periplasmic adaptor subunit, partial [Gemmatimonadota bacterium]|nr:HlyD family efflux transporter periplasmic adaptor subunit [Gemmatimonadota bacterium]
APESERRPGSRIDLGAGGPGMDVKRAPRDKRKRNLGIAAGVVGLVALTIFVMRLEPAAPSVDRDIQLFGTVERGSFVRDVQGPGTLVPEQMVFVSAVTGGRVEQVFVQPGEAVLDTTVVVRLSNPDVELEALQAQQQLTSARAGLVELERSLRTMLLQQEAAVAAADAEFRDATREADAYRELVENQTVSRNEASRAMERAETARVTLQTEGARLDLLNGTIDNQLAVQREQVARLSSIVDYQERRVASMRVRAGAAGEVQDLDLEVGQWVQPGTTLTRVAQPGRLMAELRIPETQARDVQVGQPAVIDTRNDSIAGTVRRVDPNVQNGSVLVEVRLTEALPPGARPDLTVDGTIELERLQDVLYVDRPTYGQANSSVSLFKVSEDGDEAVRVTVRLGRSSVSQIEVLEGLREGDTIILSDLSRVQDADRVRLR